MPDLPVLLMLAAERWRPFLDPMRIHDGWRAMLLAIPLIIVIALVYKTLKLPSLAKLGQQTLQLTFYILFLMIASAAVLWALALLM